MASELTWITANNGATVLGYTKEKYTKNEKNLLVSGYRVATKEEVKAHLENANYAPKADEVKKETPKRETSKREEKTQAET